MIWPGKVCTIEKADEKTELYFRILTTASVLSGRGFLAGARKGIPVSLLSSLCTLTSTALVGDEAVTPAIGVCPQF